MLTEPGHCCCWDSVFHRQRRTQTPCSLHRAGQQTRPEKDRKTTYVGAAAVIWRLQEEEEEEEVRRWTAGCLFHVPPAIEALCPSLEPK